MSQPQVDYGYGDAQPDYGYGEAQPDYGYDDAPAAAPAQPTPQGGRPRRRGSVTKYSLEEAGKKEGTVEAEMVNQLNAAQMLNHFRQGGR